MADSESLPPAKGKGVGERSCQVEQNCVWLHLQLSTVVYDWRCFETVHDATGKEGLAAYQGAHTK